MKLNREKSRLINGVITLALVGGIAAGGITIYANTTTNNDSSMSNNSSIICDSRPLAIMNDYYQNVEDPEMELFDEDFVSLFNNGSLIVNDEGYSLKDVYIVKGKSNGNDCIFLQDYHKPTTDILTGDELPTDFEREKIMLLAYSTTFYNYYLNNKDSNNIELNSDNIDEFREYINNFEPVFNDKLPETYYYVHPKTRKSK